MAIPKNFKELVGIAIGEASMCWSETPKGVFDSTRASAIVDRIVAAVESTTQVYDKETIVFLHQRRGELCIERDEARAQAEKYGLALKMIKVGCADPRGFAERILSEGVCPGCDGEDWAHNSLQCPELIKSAGTTQQDSPGNSPKVAEAARKVFAELQAMSPEEFRKACEECSTDEAEVTHEDKKP